jgi:hypothetical protein
MTVARKPGRRGEHVISRKAIARGVPGDSGVTCMLVCASTTTYAHETAGRIGRPAFPAPSIWRGWELITNLGRMKPRDREGMSRDRHCEPTGRANARPMTGSAKQSIFLGAATWIASSQVLPCANASRLSQAMTESSCSVGLNENSQESTTTKAPPGGGTGRGSYVRPAAAAVWTIRSGGTEPYSTT